MKIKALFSIICALSLALASPRGAGRAEEYSVHSLSMTGYITSSGVNVRSGPGTEHSSYGTAGAGEIMRVVSSAAALDGSLWYYGQVGGISGWVHSAYVSSAPVSRTAAPTAAPQTGGNTWLSFTGTVSADKANVRAGASVDTGAVAQLVYGARVLVLSGAMDAGGALWYYCEYSSGRYGYIRADLVTSGTVPAPAPTAAPVTPVSFKGYTNTEAVNVRTAPNGERTARLSRGTRVNVTGQITVSGVKWYLVSWSGGTGYIRADLISRVSFVTAAPTAYVFTETPLSFVGMASKNDCNVRCQPAYGADILFRADAGEILDVFALCLDGEGRLWYHIRTADSRMGYILAELVSVAAAPGGIPSSASSLVPDVGGSAAYPAATPVPDMGGSAVYPAASLVPDVGGSIYAPTVQPTSYYITSGPTVQPTSFYITSGPTVQPTSFYITSGPTVQPTASPAAPGSDTQPGDGTSEKDMPILSFNPLPCVPGQTLSVYSAPSVIAWRADEGSASVLTTDNLWCAGSDGQWLLILYHTAGEEVRVGYISASSLQGALTGVPPLELAARSAMLVRSAGLIGDPLGQTGESLPLEAGTNVTCLGYCYLGSTWAYVETRTGGLPVRGFLPMDALQIR